jgi:hypothetical protein
MSNIIDKLFESVGQLPFSNYPDWVDALDLPFDENDDDPWEREISSSDDGVFTLDEIELANDTMDRITGSRNTGLTSSEEREIFGGGVRHRGMEVLAFYKSKRFIHRNPYRGKWGIFYLRPGLSFLEHEIEKTYPGFGNTRLLALEFLRMHERFHFLADVQTILFESTLKQQLYEPIRKAFRGRQSFFVEEALANRHAWDWAKKPSVGLEEFAYDFMSLQPNAYARFSENRISLASEWAGIVVDQGHPLHARREDLSHWVEAFPKSFLRSSLCPEYVVYPSNLSRWISPAYILPPVREIKDDDKITKLLSGRFIQLKDSWESTKSKLLSDSLLSGLDFKPWKKDGRDCCSVRINKNFRAHLRHIGNGSWLAYVLGSHKELGHG